MKTLAKRVLAATALATLTSAAYSGTLECKGGTLAQLTIHQPGMVFIRLSNMNALVGVCSMDTTWAPAGSTSGVTTPAACKAIYAALMVAKQSGSVIPSMVFDGDQVPPSCTMFTAWAYANLRFYDM